MDDTTLVELIKCHICPSALLSHPLYKKSGSKYCPRHGDFFIQRLRGEAPVIIFRSFEGREEVAVWKSIPLSDVVTSTPTMSFIPNPAFLKKEPIEIPTTVKRVQSASGHPGVILLCNQTGQIFGSVKEAAETLELGRTSISKHLSGIRNHVQGYTFTRLE